MNVSSLISYVQVCYTAVTGRHYEHKSYISTKCCISKGLNHALCRNDHNQPLVVFSDLKHGLSLQLGCMKTVLSSATAQQLNYTMCDNINYPIHLLHFPSYSHTTSKYTHDLTVHTMYHQ